MDMRGLTKVLIVIVVILAIVVGALSFLYVNDEGPLKSTLNANVLVLCVDPSEGRPGPGAVDMAFMVGLQDGNVKNLTPIYPGGMRHPTAEAPDFVKTQGLYVLVLHDSLWYENTTYDAQLAQEIVEYNTGMKSDVVVMVKPEAIDAVIQSIGGVNVEGQGYVQGDTLEFLRAEQSEGGMSRGNAIESVADAIKSAAQDKDKRQAIMTTIIAQYNAGNIIVEPNDWAVRFMTAESINKVFG
jgi:hypothetical protein